MARAIQAVVEAVKTKDQIQAESLRAIDAAMADNVDSIVQFVHLLRELHDKGLLAMANAVLEQSTNIMEILVNMAQKPEYAGGLKNLLVIGDLFGKLDMNLLTGLLLSLAQAKEKVTKGEAQQVKGVFDLLGAMGDPDVKAGLTFMVEVLRSLGRDVRRVPG